MPDFGIVCYFHRGKMRTATQKIAINEKIFSSFTIILYQMMLLVLYSFLFQTLFPANGSSFESGSAKVNLAKIPEQHQQNASWQIHSPLPPKVANLLLEVELSTEDDEDRRNTFSDFCKPFPGNASCNEVVYNRSLKHRFLHLNSQVNNQPSIAFFILYHSWKSDLT